MADTPTRALSGRLKWLARRPDWLALAGLALVLLALVIYAFGVRPVEMRRLALTDRLVELQGRTQSTASGAGQTNPEQQLSSFYARLADARQAPEIARQVHDYARAAGLTLERGDYRPVADASGKFVRYQIVLPVNGNYLQIRRFLADAMREMPGLALDAISFEREDAQSAQLQAQLRFTAFLRNSS